MYEKPNSAHQHAAIHLKLVWQRQIFSYSIQFWFSAVIFVENLIVLYDIMLSGNVCVSVMRNGCKWQAVFQQRHWKNSIRSEWIVFMLQICRLTLSLSASVCIMRSLSLDACSSWCAVLSLNHAVTHFHFRYEKLIARHKCWISVYAQERLHTPAMRNLNTCIRLHFGNTIYFAIHFVAFFIFLYSMKWNSILDDVCSPENIQKMNWQKKCSERAIAREKKKKID